MVITRGSGGGGAAFSPLDITGLAGWYDFSDIATLFTDAARTIPVTADGDAIGACDDKSGNTRHATQATAGAKPTYKAGIKNQLSIGRFDGGDQLKTANFGLTQPTTVVMVYQMTTFVSLRYVIDGLPDPNKMAILSNTVSSASRYNAGTTRIVTGGLSVASFGLLTVLFSGASSYYRLNGSELDAGNVGTTAANGITLGNNPYGTAGFTGDIAEVVIYSTALSTGDRGSLEAYLNGKWAVY